jgi:hypothetical protein
MSQPLTINGLLMPPDFPAAAYERTYARARLRAQTHASAYDHFGSAWNAVSFRFMALVNDGDEFATSIDALDGAANLDQRYRQERHLFGFFSNGFSAFEAFFYGMFAIGALVRPADFSLATPKDQQAISPVSTNRAYMRAFPGDPILAAFQSLFTDSAYQELKEVRNVLNHRTAPGRTIFVSIGSDEDLPPRWKINDIPLDGQMAANRRAHHARLLGMLLDAAAAFAETLIA